MNCCAILLTWTFSALEGLAHRLHVAAFRINPSRLAQPSKNCVSCSQRRLARIPLMSARTLVPVVGASTTEIWTWRGHKIRFARSGKDTGAPPLVLIHGFGSSADTWRMQFEPLSAGREVFALDLLGFGRSDKALVDYSIDLWREQVQDFIAEHIEASRPVVVGGNSIGSLVAITFAANADTQQRIAGLIFFNAAAGMNSRFIATNPRVPFAVRLIAKPAIALLDALLRIDTTSKYLFENLRTPTTIASVLAKSVYVDATRVDGALVASIAEPAEDKRAREVFVRILTGDPGTPPDELMPKVDMSIPILMCWGDADQITPKDVIYGTYFTQELRAERPATTSLAVVRAGHCPQDDAPDAVNLAVLEWLKELNY